MVLSLFYHLDMVQLVNTLRPKRSDREFEPLYPDKHIPVGPLGTIETNGYRCKLGNNTTGIYT